MKPKYTLIIRDNDTGERILELDVEKTSFSYSQKTNVQVYRGQRDSNNYHHLGTGVKVDIQAQGFLPKEIEKEPKIYELDETEECFHEWSTYLGLSFSDSTCKKCGADNES